MFTVREGTVNVVDITKRTGIERGEDQMQGLGCCFNRDVASGDHPEGVVDVTRKLIPAPRRAGTAKKTSKKPDTSLERLLGITGNDPDTLLMLIAICERVIASRPRRPKKKSTRAR